MKKIVKSTIQATVLALGFTLSAGPLLAAPVAIGTLPQGSLGFSIASGVAQVAADKAGINARAVGQGGSSVYIPALNQGEIGFATSNTFEAVFAINGSGNFEGRPNPDVRVAALLQPFAVGIMVARDGDIQSVDDLKGQPFPTGYARQKLVKVMQDAIFSAAGMSEADVEGVPVANFVEGAGLLAQGTVTGVLLAPGSGVVKKTNAQRPVRFISLPPGDEAAATISRLLPGSYVRRMEPSKRLPEITEPVDLIGYQYALLTHVGADEETVYNMVKTLHANKEALIETHGSFRGFDPDKMAVQTEGAPFHPGAIRFYKEIGIWE